MGATPEANIAEFPFFRDHDVSEIARVMRRSETYVSQVKAGLQPLTNKFKEDAVHFFGGTTKSQFD